MLECVSLKIESLVYEGYGLSRLPDGKAVFIPFVLPGEQVQVRVIEEKRGHAIAELVSVEKPSPERIPPRCVHFGICGGCHYQHIPYNEQLDFKKAIFIEQLQRMAGIKAPIFSNVIPSTPEWNYRNSLQFNLNNQGKLCFSDFYNNQLFEVKECHLPLTQIGEVWPLAEFESGIDIERVEYRQNGEGELIMVMRGGRRQMPELASESALSIVHQFGDDGIILTGDGYLVMSIKDREFKVSAGSFFQTNFSGAEALLNCVSSAVKENNPLSILEVYCGVGLLTSFLADSAETIASIESSNLASEDFIENLDAFDNISLFQGKAENILPNLEGQFDCILVDPPRAGLKREVTQAIIKKSPAVLVYVSCNPSTLARDTKHLAYSGYHLESSTIVDMFPQTFHIESVNIFRK